MSIRILTDSASDITREEMAAYGVDLIPMPVVCGAETYLDDKSVPVEFFWEKLLNDVPVKTSQPTPDAFLSAFEEAKQAGDEVICIVISSALSGTYQSALSYCKMAEYEPIYIVDADCAAAAAAEKMLVFEACRLRDAGGLTAAQIVEKLEAFRSRIRLFACIDTLKYLALGGRLSKAAAQIGTLANIKPMITLSEKGEIRVIKKTMGNHRAMRDLAAEVLQYRVSSEYPVIPIYAYDDANVLKFMEQLRKAGFTMETKPQEQIGATIGAYIGPGGYGIVFVEEE